MAAQGKVLQVARASPLKPEMVMLCDSRSATTDKLMNCLIHVLALASEEVDKAALPDDLT
jgi:hypothetical protein